VLYKGIENNKKITPNQYEKILELNPMIKEIFDIIDSFRCVLKSKDPRKLIHWINESRSKNIEEINSFINGIESDIEAVRNSIQLSYNNGLAEGKVNKIKMIKRIMFGRNTFEPLRKKVLYLEQNFN
jgi:transposase